MALLILSFELSYKNGRPESWFAISAKEIGRKGTFAFIQAKIKSLDLTFGDFGGHGYTFTRKEYSMLKNLLVREDTYYNLGTSAGGISSTGLYTLNAAVRKIVVTKI